jgi:hypothetical protein
MIEYTIKIYQIIEKRPAQFQSVILFSHYNEWNEVTYNNCHNREDWEWESGCFTLVKEDDYWFELPKDWEGKEEMKMYVHVEYVNKYDEVDSELLLVSITDLEFPTKQALKKGRKCIEDQGLEVKCIGVYSKEDIIEVK